LANSKIRDKILQGKRQLQLKNLFTFFIFLLISCENLCASAPEGLETFALLGIQSTYKVEYSNTNSLWQDPQQNVAISGGFGLGSDWFLSLGVLQTTDVYSESAAYLKMDWIFLQTTSLSLKYNFETFADIETTRESIGLEYNIYLPYINMNLPQVYTCSPS